MRIWHAASARCVWASGNLSPRATGIAFTLDARRIVAADEQGQAGPRVWAVDWEFEAAGPADWDEGARPYVDAFLTLLASRNGEAGPPLWSEPELQWLLDTLAGAGYGWLHPEGVRRRLDTLAGSWQEPPPLGESTPEPEPSEVAVLLIEPESRTLFRYQAAQCMLGRADSCDVVLDHNAVSRHHLILQWRNGVLWAIDNGSRNGTEIGGRPIGEQALRSGDRIVLARGVTIEVQFTQAP